MSNDIISVLLLISIKNANTKQIFLRTTNLSCRGLMVEEPPDGSDLVRVSKKLPNFAF